MAEHASETAGKVNGPTPQQLAAHERRLAEIRQAQQQQSGRK